MRADARHTRPEPIGPARAPHALDLRSEPAAPAAGWCVRALLLALVTLALAACAHLRPVGEPRSYRLSAALPAEHVRAVLLRGLAASGFQIDEETPGVVHASSHMRDSSVHVVVSYDATAYAIAYADSTGLGAEVDPQGRVVVDRRYHRIVERLGTQIAHALATTPIDYAAAARTGAPVPPSYAGTGATWGADAGADAGADSGAGADAGADSDAGAGAGAPAGSTAPGPTTSAVPPTAPPPAVAPATIPPQPVAVVPSAQLPPPQPVAVAPLAASERSEPRVPIEREPIHALVAVGAVLFGGGWIANWAVTLSISTEEVMIGESFVPIVGPFTQLGELRWDVYGRWTGAWYPIAGVIQISGLIMAVVGQTVQLPVRRPRAAAAAGSGRSWAIAPLSVAGQGAGLSVAGSF